MDYKNKCAEEKTFKSLRRKESKPYGGKGIPGIYMLFRNGELIYIGQYIDVHARVRAHKSCGRKFDFAAYGFCQDPNERSEIEKDLIARYRPAENNMSKPVMPDYF